MSHTMMESKDALQTGKYEVELIGKVTTTIGTYPDSDEYGDYTGRPVEWRVLDVDTSEKRVLVISDAVLPLPENVTHSPTDSSTNYSWEKSGIRSWLNSDEEEKFKKLYGLSDVDIAPVDLETELYADFSEYKIDKQEKIFLLSYNEVALTTQSVHTGTENNYVVYQVKENRYFSDESDQFAYDLNGNLAQWWLRSPCSINYEEYKVATNTAAEYIQLTTNKDGYSVATFGFVNTNAQSGVATGIRPAFWLDLSAEE